MIQEGVQGVYSSPQVYNERSRYLINLPKLDHFFRIPDYLSGPKPLRHSCLQPSVLLPCKPNPDPAYFLNGQVTSPGSHPVDRLR